MRHRSAFTLVELVVVIGIIVVLAGLTVAVSVTVIGASEARQTENVIRVLDIALSEWQLGADRKVTFGIDGFDVNGNTPPNATPTYDLQSGTPHRLGLTELLITIGRNQEITEILVQIDPNLMHRFDTSQTPPIWITQVSGDPDPNASGAQSVYSSNDLNGVPLDDALAVLDAWDQPIRVIHPGATFFPPVDADGTEQTLQEQLYGVAAKRQICFVSAGPDGKFGDLTQPSDSEAYMEADDNLYSYEVIKP